MKSYSKIRVARACAAVAVMGALLSSCGSTFPSPQHPDSHLWGQKQSMGWTTSMEMREAEQKSIARDMPFNSVTASGRIVQ